MWVQIIKETMHTGLICEDFRSLKTVLNCNKKLFAWNSKSVLIILWESSGINGENLQKSL